MPSRKLSPKGQNRREYWAMSTLKHFLTCFIWFFWVRWSQCLSYLCKLYVNNFEQHLNIIKSNFFYFYVILSQLNNFQCITCEKIFPNGIELSNHEESSHGKFLRPLNFIQNSDSTDPDDTFCWCEPWSRSPEESGRFNCDQCGFTINLRRTMKIHKTKQHQIITLSNI